MKVTFWMAGIAVAFGIPASLGFDDYMYNRVRRDKMELLRSALGFFLSNADILAIILLSIAVIRLSIDSTTQEKEIKDLKVQIENIKKTK